MSIFSKIKKEAYIFPVLRQICPPFVRKALATAVRTGITFHLSFIYRNYPSYYPECASKNPWRLFCDLMRWDIKTRDCMEFFYLYGLDIAGITSAVADEYISQYGSFSRQRDKANRLNTPHTQAVLLRDKYLFYRLLVGNHIATPPVFAFSIDGALYDSSLQPITQEELPHQKCFFVKDNGGECASFVKRITDVSQLAEYRDKLAVGQYIYQEPVIQHLALSRLNAGSINTIRLVTILKDNVVHTLAAGLRIGTKSSGHVDNWAAGGVFVGLNPDGTLKEYGYYKPGKGGKTNVHPDSGIAFKDFAIPYYAEAVALACKAHKIFYNVHSIGWDIAIAETGPVIIEGNDNWEISLMQAVQGGLKQRWTELLPN